MPFWAGRVGADPDVEIAREAGITMEGHGVASDDEVVNPVRVERLDKLSRVFRQFDQGLPGGER